MKAVILGAVGQLSFGIGEQINQYAKSVQKRIKFQRSKKVTQNINRKQKKNI